MSELECPNKYCEEKKHDVPYPGRDGFSCVTCDMCPGNPELRWTCGQCGCWEQLSTNVVCTTCITATNSATYCACGREKWGTTHECVEICGTRHLGCSENDCSDFCRCVYTTAELVTRDAKKSCALYRLMTDMCERGTLYVQVDPEQQEFFRLSGPISTMTDGAQEYTLESVQREGGAIRMRKHPAGRHEVVSIV